MLHISYAHNVTVFWHGLLKGTLNLGLLACDPWLGAADLLIFAYISNKSTVSYPYVLFSIKFCQEKIRKYHLFVYSAIFLSVYCRQVVHIHIRIRKHTDVQSHCVLRFKRFLHTFIMFIWLTLNPFRPKWCFKNFELNFINYRCCMHGYIKKLQTEALKFLLSEYFF